MKKNTIFLFLLLLFFAKTLQADNLAMGKWRTHLAYNTVSIIAQSDQKIYAVGDSALFSVDKRDGSIELYSKISGLHDNVVGNFEYDNNSKQLLIVYVNGNMDIMGSGGIINIPDLYNKPQISDKRVNHIYFYGNKAFLSCNFGIIVLNIQKNEIAETYYIGPNASEVQVLNTTVHNGFIYALTKDAIYQASVNEPNLVNYEFWTIDNTIPGSGNFQSIVSFANQLFILRNGEIYKKDSNNLWTSFFSENSGITATNLSVSNGKMIIYTDNNVYVVDEVMNLKTINYTGKILDVEYDAANNLYWLAANSQGVISYQENADGMPIISTYKPSGPVVNIPWKMRFSGQKLFVVPGGRWSNQNDQPGYVMIYENGVWTNIDGKNIEAQTGKKVLDFMDIAIDPADPSHFYVPSYGTGVYEFKNNQFTTWHNFTNSTIETIFPDNPNSAYLYMRMDGGVFDTEGNVWFTNSLVPNGIKFRKSDDTWSQLTYASLSSKPTLGELMILKQKPQQKWVLSVRSEPGIGIFDDNGTLDEQNDDKDIFYSSFQTSDERISPTAFYCITQDKNGVVWVGTDMGPLLFYNPTNAFNSTEFMASRVKIPRNDGTNLADYLLADEKVKAIAIDGANRKWIGTESSGVYLMSENGQETIHHFTTFNSPLLSNNILSIAINPVTGEVFFGTGNGLISYQSDAAEAGDIFGNVYAYPNPVRENYKGVITITGLVDKSHVKITDLNGNLICETVSNGSIATWDGKDVHGRRVNTGIYLVICTNSEGSQSAITKILVIN